MRSQRSLTRFVASLMGAALLVAACNGGGESSTGGARPERATSESDESVGDDSDPIVSGAPDDSTGDEGDDAAVDQSSDDSGEPSGTGAAGDIGAGGAMALGFDVERFDVPLPETPGETGAFDGVDELIETGIDAGAWTEIEGVRAIISVIMGELSPEAVGGFDELTHPSIPDVLDRAEQLLADDSIDASQRDDLARLTRFFFDDDDVDAASGATRPEGLVRPRDAPPLVRQAQNPCPGGVGGAPESELGAAASSRPYCRRDNGADTVYFPVRFGLEDDPEVWERSADRFFDLIESTRAGYLDLVGTEMPPVTFLISPRPAPDPVVVLDSEVSFLVAAHVVSHSATRCKGAIFATETFLEQDRDLDSLMAHELFHCVQGVWEGEFTGIGEDFAAEAGASYFAYRLLGQACVSVDIALGPVLDRRTANGSLLSAAHDGWFFWAFLDEHGKLDPAQIGQLHQAFKSGTPIEEAIRSFVPDVEATMNEFYARMMGPGLACSFQGSEVTGEIDITDAGQVDLPDAPWQGTRYRVTYPAKRYFAQTAGDGGPIGMAEFDRRSDPGSWVAVEPEIRSTCDDAAAWLFVVATAPAASSGGVPDRAVQVTERQDPRCDPCLIGTWAFDLNTLAEFFESFVPPGQVIDFSISGDWTMQFAADPNGGAASVADSQDVVITVASQAGGFPIDLTGEGQGVWSSNGQSLALSDYQSTGTASLLGASGSSSSSDAGTVGYSCAGNSMSYTANGATFGLNRIDPLKGDPYF